METKPTPRTIYETRQLKAADIGWGMLGASLGFQMGCPEPATLDEAAAYFRDHATEVVEVSGWWRLARDGRMVHLWDKDPSKSRPFPLGWGLPLGAFADRHPYVVLVDEADCSPDSPAIHHPGDRKAQARWLADRLHTRAGVTIDPAEVESWADSFWQEMG